ncbi:MAG: hypothetical protein PUD59_00580, partial [bacterium]|nr:hypothetical protein [bacterium]
MKRVYIKRFLEFILFAIIFIALLNITSRLFVPKWITEGSSNEKNVVDSFTTLSKNSLDIMFVGNSDMYDAVSPMELWNDYGISSYNYSFPHNRIWLSYYNIKSVFERQNPKYIFLLVDDIFNSKQTYSANVIKTIASMPFSKTKIEAFLNKDIHKRIEIRTSCFFPIIRFHSRYNELTDTDFKYAFSKAYYPSKGFERGSGIKPYKNNYNYLDQKRTVEFIPEKNIK